MEYGGEEDDTGSGCKSGSDATIDGTAIKQQALRLAEDLSLPSSKPVKIGSWGGDGGTKRDVQARPSRLVSVTIHSGDTIDAISFSYMGSNNVQYCEGPWGGSGGEEDKINLDRTNYVTEISGTTGATGAFNNVVTSLKIVTLKGDPKTYGKAVGTPFRIPVQDGGKIVGFFGRSGTSLDAIGLYVLP